MYDIWTMGPQKLYDVAGRTAMNMFLIRASDESATSDYFFLGVHIAAIFHCIGKV